MRDPSLSSSTVSRRTALAALGAGALGVAASTWHPRTRAQDASPSPTGVLNQETLVEVTLPADVLPFELMTEVGLVLDTVPAGSTTVYTADAGGCCPAVPAQSVTYILEGTSTFRSQGPAYVVRPGGGAPEPVAVDSAVDLAPGDAILYRDEIGWEWTVTGEGPMRLLSTWVAEGATLPSPDLASWVLDDYQITMSNAVPAAALTVRLVDATLEAGATLSPGSAVVQVAVTLPDDQARLSQGSDGGIKNVGKEPVRLYVASLSPAGPEAEVVVAGMQATPVAATPVAATPAP
jgi:hypothetical protein